MQNNSMQNQTSTGNRPIWNTKLARNIVPVAVGLVCIPMMLTVLMLGKAGRLQIALIADRMAAIDRQTIQDAGSDFQRLGRDAVQRSSRQASDISSQAIHNFSQRELDVQSAYLKAAAAASISVTKSALANSTVQSLQTHRQILEQVADQTRMIVTDSTRKTQNHAVLRIKDAMAAQIDSGMQERAEQLAQILTQNIQTHQNYLALTAQMPEFMDGDIDGQKAILDALVRRFPMFIMVAAIDQTGQETAMSAVDHVVTSADLVNCGQASYFKAGMADHTSWSVDELPPGNAPVLRLATPIERYHGRAVGVLTARLSLSDAWDALRGTRIGTSGFAYVLDGFGRNLLAPAKTGEMLQVSAPIDVVGWRVCVAEPRQEALRPIEALQSDIAEANQQALDRLRSDIATASGLADRQMESDASTLEKTAESQVDSRSNAEYNRFSSGAAQQTQSEVLVLQRAIEAKALEAEQANDIRMDGAAKSAVERMARRIRPMESAVSNQANRRLSVFAATILVCSLLLGTLVALVLTASIVQPVIRLAQGTRGIAAGNLEERVDDRAPGEIRDLAVAFNTMAASLRQSRTELRQAETQLVHSAKLASLGTLSAGVAHELNQPLAIIRGIAQQLSDEPDLSAAVTDDLALIEGQTSRMMKIVKHLRTFSRIGSQELVAVDLNQVIQDCLILIGAQLKAHNIEVEMNLQEGLPSVGGDANELEQVFLNLLSNARDALDGRDGARLTIRTMVEGNNVVAEFADNGPGIPQDIAGHIFDPFFTTKEPGKGTGLGLSISHGIIERHHGSIKVIINEGAIFRIDLPMILEEYVTQKAA